MKKVKKVIALVGILVLTGCAGTTDAKGKTGSESISDVKVESEIDAEQCGICGDKAESLMGYYRKMDSVGIVCLNTMNICNTDVRVYDDDGKETFGDGGSSIHNNSYGEDECHVTVSGTPSRGLSRVEVNYGKQSTPDFDSLKNTLCQKCLDSVTDLYNEELEYGEDAFFPDACLVDFTTNELYPLGSHNIAYFIRDYYVSINHRDAEDSLLIFYAPERK